MCCNNAYCNAEADVENFEAKNNFLPRGQQVDQPTINTHATTNNVNRGDRSNQMRGGPGAGGNSVYSGSYSYERGATNILSHGNEYSGFGGATSGHGMYEEPQIDILANSRRAQLVDALGKSAQKGAEDYGTDSGAENGAINPDALLMRENAQWMEYRNKLENALNNDAPLLELTI